jgi:hypothetical protein
VPVPILGWAPAPLVFHLVYFNDTHKSLSGNGNIDSCQRLPHTPRDTNDGENIRILCFLLLTEAFLFLAFVP